MKNMRIKRSTRKPSTPNLATSKKPTTRSRYTSNILSLIDEWGAHRIRTGADVNLAVEALLTAVDFNHVLSLRAVFEAVCSNLSERDLAELSEMADDERSLLTQVVGGEALRVERELDPTLVTFLDKIGRTPRHGGPRSRW